MESCEEEMEINALALVKQIARMRAYDAESGDGDDAMETCNSLISRARDIIGVTDAEMEEEEDADAE